MHNFIRRKRTISFMAAVVMALTANASVAAETLSQPEMTNINGAICVMRGTDSIGR